MADKNVEKAIKTISEKGIKRGSEKAVTNAGNKAFRKIEDKAVRDAIKESGKKVMGSKLKSQAVKRGGDVVANAPLNARYAVSHAEDARKENRDAELSQLKKSFKSGKVSQEDYMSKRAAIKKKYSSLDMGDVAKDFLLNTGLDVGIGGGIDAVTGKVRKVKAANAKRIKKYESQLKGGMTREANKRAKEAAKRAEEKAAKKGFSKVGTNPVKGKTIASAETLSNGKVAKRSFDRIDKLEAAKKISKRQARQERKALTQAIQRQTGRTGFAFKGKNGIEFGRATKHGIERIDNETFGRNLGLDKRFKGNEASGRISRLKKMTPEQKADMENLKTARRIEAENKEEARSLERLSKAEKAEGYWFMLLNRGYEIGCFSTSGAAFDAGRTPASGRGATYLHMNELSEENIKNAILKGRSMVTWDCAAVVFSIGDFLSGDKIEADEKEYILKAKILWQKDRKGMIRIIRNGVDIKQIPVEFKSDDQKHMVEMTVSEKENCWYAVILESEDGKIRSAASPIYFRNNSFVPPKVIKKNKSFPPEVLAQCERLTPDELAREELIDEFAEILKKYQKKTKRICKQLG